MLSSPQSALPIPFKGDLEALSPGERRAEAISVAGPAGTLREGASTFAHENWCAPTFHQSDLVNDRYDIGRQPHRSLRCPSLVCPLVDTPIPRSVRMALRQAHVALDWLVA